MLRTCAYGGIFICISTFIVLSLRAFLLANRTNKTWIAWYQQNWVSALTHITSQYEQTFVSSSRKLIIIKSFIIIIVFSACAFLNHYVSSCVFFRRFTQIKKGIRNTLSVCLENLNLKNCNNRILYTPGKIRKLEKCSKPK